MTTTVESIFGSGRMVDGFFLNNQLTDFSFAPTGPDGRPAFFEGGIPSVGALTELAPGGYEPRTAQSSKLSIDAGQRLVEAALRGLAAVAPHG